MTTITAITLSVLATFFIMMLLGILLVAGVTLNKVSHLDTLDVRLTNMEQYLRDISDAPDTSGGRYRTADGRYMADTSEEVMMQMLEDPNSTLKDEHKEALAEFLGQLQKETEINSFFKTDDEDDEDDDDEPANGF